ncbi:28S ribosomal protein S35, mitochondrial-like [Gigantopelta aegis]|uniref:28S ribosomal protein S35, mitochondrial-like n=1 Tax=Gigantopelta aegis TaxID=1735272 RepID=UPI001B888365|nr:28S ribosomal protein S35, mitochondrial-like [Gigantopelta aegis]
MDVTIIAVRQMMSIQRKTRLLFDQRIRHFRSSAIFCQRVAKESEQTRLKQVEDEFRTYQIVGLKPKEQMKRVQRKRKQVLPPRYKQMKTDQDWTVVWPAAETFKWSVVPFPVRQGYVENLKENKGVIPEKYANAELMKIPNFLHLTPNHVKKHCAAIKDFCTPWPKGLETDAKCVNHFPLEVVSSDYLFSSPSVRDPRAHTVSVKVKLSSLGLDYHARDKLLRLVGDRYNANSDELTITSDRCPLKKQNYDYAMYLLTVLVHESWKKEPWETDKTEADMEKYIWETNKSKTNVLEFLQKIRMVDSKDKDAKISEQTMEESILKLDVVQEYKSAVSDIYNEGEDCDTLDKYKNSVLKMLNLKSSLP